MSRSHNATHRAFPAVWITLAVAMIVGACSVQAPASSAPSPAASGAAPSPTQPAPSGDAFAAVVAMLGPDGEVSPDMARQAFALAIAPLPGVTAPSGASSPINANAALEWIFGARDSLSTDQRAAVDAALEALTDPYADAPGQARTAALAGFQPGVAATERDCGKFFADPADPPTGVSTAAQPFVDMVHEAASTITNHLGRPPVRKLAVCLIPSSGPWHALTRVFDADHHQIGTPAACAVYVNSNTISGLGDSDLGYAMAYQTFRCFKATADPNETLASSQSRVIRPWVSFGTSAWAAASVAEEIFGSPGGDALSGAWTRYLTEPTIGLSLRANDAIGFMAQVDQDQPSAWDVIDEMLRAGDGPGAFYAATGRRQSFIDRWAAGYFRDASRGPDWDIVGPGIPSDTAEAGSIDIANGESKEMAAAGFAVAIADISTSADITVLAGNHLRVHDGVQDLKDVRNQAYCTRDGGPNACECPPGSPGANRPPPPALNAEAKLALTGVEFGGTATITGMSLEDYCGTSPSAEPSSALLPLPDPCALITQAEASEAAGHGVASGTSVPSTLDHLGSGLGCPFRNADGFTANVRIDALDLGTSAAQTFTAYEQGADAGGFRAGEVADLGDDNFYSHVAQGTHLFVRKRNIVLVVVVLNASGLEQAPLLARLALDRF